MKRATHAIILSAALSVGLAAQTTPRSTNTGGTNAPTTVNAAPQNSSLRILTPVANQKQTANAVNVRWQLTNEGLAAGAPNYEVQLDGADPITTSSTEHSFAGLAPGVHTIVVTLVDANGTPITGGSSQVQFTVEQQQQAVPANETAPAEKKPQSKLRFRGADLSNAAHVEQPVRDDDDAPLPSSARALPLLSIVGFGALIGGVVSARRTRRK